MSLCVIVRALCVELDLENFRVEESKSTSRLTLAFCAHWMNGEPRMIETSDSARKTSWRRQE